MERWEEDSSAAPEEQQAGMRIFGLSGGVLGHSSRTSNRIDGLLLKMIENQGSARYLGDVDRNLDYLYTSLKLDLIERVAKDVASKAVDEPDVQDMPNDPDEIYLEEVLPLDRSRTSV